jgi:hypothetical protein
VGHYAIEISWCFTGVSWGSLLECSAYEHSLCVQLFARKYNAAVNILLHIPLKSWSFYFMGETQKVGFLEQRVDVISNFNSCYTIVFKMFCAIYMFIRKSLTILQFNPASNDSWLFFAFLNFSNTYKIKRLV